jgi:hypothetical protein
MSVVNQDAQFAGRDAGEDHGIRGRDGPGLLVHRQVEVGIAPAARQLCTVLVPRLHVGVGHADPPQGHVDTGQLEFAIGYDPQRFGRERILHHGLGHARRDQVDDGAEDDQG